MHYNAMFTRIKEGNTGGLFLFHGAEEFVKQSALTQLKESVDLAVRDLNVLECRAPSAANVLEVAETLPFFAERRLVVCYEMADAEVKALVQQADDMPETTTVV
ncbi:hypothetical protein LJC07_08755, partial [Christensenellaceae bacterium OttesenSCG-928-L17]|nr:hypothetical protein [Christensenellaceae bacterium OttesenSCG-928-L17]